MRGSAPSKSIGTTEAQFPEASVERTVEWVDTDTPSTSTIRGESLGASDDATPNAGTMATFGTVTHGHVTAGESTAEPRAEHFVRALQSPPGRTMLCTTTNNLKGVLS